MSSPRGLLLSGWQPERFAPVVFRYPGPLETATGQGPFHIARLAGLPGERIALHRGDLWLLPAAEANLAAAAPAAGVARFGPDIESEQLFRAGRFRLVRKDPALALTLRRLVHDADRPVNGAAGPLAAGRRLDRRRQRRLSPRPRRDAAGNGGGAGLSAHRGGGQTKPGHRPRRLQHGALGPARRAGSSGGGELAAGPAPGV